MLPLSTTTALVLPIETIALIGFYILLGVYALYSAVLYYHWNEYATDARVTRITLTAYFVTTLPLIAIMGFVAFTL